MQQKDERTRNWTFVLYPHEIEVNTPAGWRDVLDELHIQWVESPLHDKDLSADNTPKKAHKHILLLFEGKKSYKQISEITASVNGTIPQECVSAKGLVRYMAHLDNPEKVQYLASEIIGHGGVDVAEYLKPTSSARYEHIKEMMTFVIDNNISEMQDLLMYAMTERFGDWFPLLCDNSSYVMDCLIRSIRHRSR